MSGSRRQRAAIHDGIELRRQILPERIVRGRPECKPASGDRIRQLCGHHAIELVKFDWPTKDDAHLAFALTSEGLKVGAAICLDHVTEVDTFWAHPMPAAGDCAALGAAAPAAPFPEAEATASTSSQWPNCWLRRRCL